ncbi:MAG: PPOX class F420-dependent oxidoreductase [Candidatus Heimdallarchaeota archaeon]|nr:MAG: PPOX class F420-dependent oxidoreductase [Candidatus Heimdallarchaeota archaeon]
MSQKFKELEKQKYISLTTFYKRGKGVATPVNFATENDKIYVNTSAKSWKVKRIKDNPRAKIAPCTIRGKILGESMDVSVRILSESEESKAKEVLDLKFNKGFGKIMSGMFNLFQKLRFWKEPDQRVFLEITQV